MNKNVSAIHKKMTAEVQTYLSVQSSYLKMLNQRAPLQSQLNENKCVLDELNLLSQENKVYKLIGPVLVKQDLEEARQNVVKRIEYISKELKSSDSTLQNMEKEMQKIRESVSKYEQQYKVATSMI